MSLVHIGNYRIGKTLGVGSFGKVKLAEHEQTGKKCAVKIHNRAKIRQQQLEEKVKREIKILKMCMHPHIIRLYEVIETPTDVYVFIEYSSGGELFDYIVERGRLSETEARRFFQQLVSGVEYCHSNMIAHRDLKPENLLLDDNGNVKIADFGLSNCMRDGWFLKTSCGSPNYAAPEVISGKLYAGPEVDIWSCGVILYALLCGTLPFDDESIPYLFKKIKGGIYILPSYLSDESKDLISKMLVTDPLKRITIAEIRQHSWFRHNLPSYLSVPPKIGRELMDINEELVRKIAAQMDKPFEKVIRALRKGKRNHLTAGYHLVQDSLRSVELSHHHHFKDQSVGLLESASTDSSSSITPGAANADTNMFQDHYDSRPIREWRAGITLRQRTANEAMMEVYRVLSDLRMKWKTPPNQHFQVRCLVERPEFESSVRLSIQLYKIPPSQYVLDLQRIDGDTLAYLAVCAELMRALQM